MPPSSNRLDTKTTICVKCLSITSTKERKKCSACAGTSRHTICLGCNETMPCAGERESPGHQLCPKNPPFTGTQVFEVEDVDVAFPTEKPWFTPYAAIPAEYREWGNPWAELASDVFYNGARDVELATGDTSAETAQKVGRMLRVVIGCWGIKHEHKEALAGYILGSFFTGYKTPKRSYNYTSTTLDGGSADRIE